MASTFYSMKGNPCYAVLYSTWKQRCSFTILLLYQPTGNTLFGHKPSGHHVMFIYLLTYSMVQSLSWEANWFAASQEISRISRNPKVHYRTHKRPPPVSILSQPNPIHISTSHLLEIHPNIIHPSTPRSPQWSLSLRFPHQDPYTPPSPHPYVQRCQVEVSGSGWSLVQRSPTECCVSECDRESSTVRVLGPVGLQSHEKG